MIVAVCLAWYLVLLSWQHLFCICFESTLVSQYLFTSFYLSWKHQPQLDDPTQPPISDINSLQCLLFGTRSFASLQCLLGIQQVEHPATNLFPIPSHPATAHNPNCPSSHFSQSSIIRTASINLKYYFTDIMSKKSSKTEDQSMYCWIAHKVKNGEFQFILLQTLYESRLHAMCGHACAANMVQNPSLATVSGVRMLGDTVWPGDAVDGTDRIVINSFIDSIEAIGPDILRTLAHHGYFISDPNANYGTLCNGGPIIHQQIIGESVLTTTFFYQMSYLCYQIILFDQKISSKTSRIYQRSAVSVSSLVKSNSL